MNNTNRKSVKRINLRIFVFILLSIGMPSLCFSQSYMGTTNAVNHAAAVRSLERASYLLGEGLYEQALFEASLGTQYDSNLADFPYIESLALLARSESRALVLSKLSEALSDGLVWRVYAKTEARILCAQLYAETLRYTEALALLDILEPYVSADVQYIKAVSYYGLARIDVAQNSIKLGLERWPFDPRFPKLFLQQHKNKPLTSEARKIADTILARLYVWEEACPELLLLSSYFEPNKEKRVQNITIYRTMYMPHTEKTKDFLALQEASILALKYGLISDMQAVQEIFSFSSSGIVLGFLQDLGALAVSGEARSLLRTSIKNYSGVLIDDANNDGLIDSSIIFEYGRPSFAFFDPEQDGIGRFEVVCSLGRPTKIIDTKKSYTVIFDAYPAIKTVLAQDGLEYTLQPQSLLWEPIRWSLVPLGSDILSLYTLKLTKKEPALTKHLLIHSSIYYTEPDPERTGGTLRYVLEQGIPISAEAKDAQGVYRYTTYLNGYPSVAQLDRDGDGYFETMLYYSFNGQLKNAVVDLNKNKTAEYRETYNSDGSVLYEWDTNEDGIWDVSWQDGPGSLGIITYLHPNSKMPVQIETQNNLPRTLMYQEKNIPIVKDPEYDIWWIGRIPSDIQEYSQLITNFFNHSASSVVSTMIEYKKSRVFVVRTGGYIFADVYDE